MAICPNCGKDVYFVDNHKPSKPDTEIDRYHELTRMPVEECSCGYIFSNDRTEMTEADKAFLHSEKFKQLISDNSVYENAYYDFMMFFMLDHEVNPDWYKILAFSYLENKEYGKMIIAFDNYILWLSIYIKKNISVLEDSRDESKEEKQEIYQTGIMPMIEEEKRVRQNIIRAIEKYMPTFGDDNRLFEYLRIEQLFFLERFEEAVTELNSLDNVSEDIKEWFKDFPETILGRYKLCVF